MHPQRASEGLELSPTGADQVGLQLLLSIRELCAHFLNIYCLMMKLFWKNVKKEGAIQCWADGRTRQPEGRPALSPRDTGQVPWGPHGLPRRWRGA